MIDGSEKRKRQLAFELQNSHVCEKRSKDCHAYATLARFFPPNKTKAKKPLALNKKEATQWTSSFSFILAIWIPGDCCSFKILLKIHASVGKSIDLMMTAFVIRQAKTKQIPMSTFACCLFCTRPINTGQDSPSP